MSHGGGGGKGGALLMNWLLGSTGNNGSLTGRNGGGTEPRPAASHASGREESGTVEFCDRLTISVSKVAQFTVPFPGAPDTEERRICKSQP